MRKNKKGILRFVLSALAFTCLGCFVNANLPVQAEAAEISPIAKYEFKDETNFGKDSMGNYDMEYRNLYVSDGTGATLNEATAIDGGGVTFDGNFCVAQDAESNMFADVTAFSLCFEIKTAKGSEEWESYIGVGNSTDHFEFIGRGPSYPGQLRLYTYNMVATSNKYYSAPKIFEFGSSGGTTAPTEFQKIIVTVQPGGDMFVYLNGEKLTLKNPNNSTAWDTSIDSDWATATGTSYFAIGGRYNGAVDRTSSGSIRNVAFYDFAMDQTCAAAYNENGKVTADDVAGLTYIESASVEFADKATSAPLLSSMTETQMLAAVNEATATLTLSDETTVSTGVTWKEVVEEDGKYYAKGSISTSKLGYANVYGTEVSYELPIVALKYASLTAADDFGLNFYVDIPNATASAATMQIEDKAAETVEGVYDTEKGLWKFSYSVAAKEYDKTVSFALSEIDGETVAEGLTGEYSVKAYTQDIAAGEYEENVKTLAAALAEYCESAKVFFDDTLAASAVKVTENVISSDDLTSYRASLTGSDENVTMNGASLVLKDKTVIHVYFTAADDQTVCTVNGESAAAEAVEGADGLYVLKIAVAARDLSTTQTVAVGGYTLTYSALSYVAAAVDTDKAALYNVLQALYDYSVAADNYLG